MEISHGDLKVWNVNHESCYVLCFLVTFRNTTEHDQKTADDNDNRAGEWDDADD